MIYYWLEVTEMAWFVVFSDVVFANCFYEKRTDP